MPIEIKPNMPKAEILTILNNVWKLPDAPDWKRSKDIPCRDYKKLHEDIAAICEFLSNRDAVIRNLEPLDTRIRTELDKTERSNLKGRVNQAIQNRNADALSSNTGKLLSGLLDECEKTFGFNSLLDLASARGKLHTTAQTVGDRVNSTPTSFNWTDYNPQKIKEAKNLPEIDLPQGVPTLTGILLKSFNPVLLKNGYHWKDPGADAIVHGEFTHRIQWFAICSAWMNGELHLANEPIQVFKSMGYHTFTTAQNEGVNTYLWILCCDCFQEGQQAQTNPGQPFSKTFNCPNILNSFLSKPLGPLGWGQLSYLKALMAGRRIKREGEDPTKTDKAITAGAKPVRFGVTSPEDKGGAIWWPKR